MTENSNAGLFKDYDDFGARLKARFDELKDANEKLTLKNSIMEKEMKEKQEKLDEKTSQCDKFKKLNENLRVKINGCDEKNKKLEAKLKKVTEDLKRVTDKNKLTEASFAEKSAELETVVEANKQLNNEVSVIESRFAKVVTERNELVDSKKELSLKVQKLKRKSSESKKPLSIIKCGKENENPFLKLPRLETTAVSTVKKRKTSEAKKLLPLVEPGKEKKKVYKYCILSKRPQTTPISSEKKQKVNPKLKATKDLKTGGRHDLYCWECHVLEEFVLCCDGCPRVYHEACLQAVGGIIVPEKDFLCPECTTIQDAERSAIESPSVKNVSSDELSELLGLIVDALYGCVPGLARFLKPFDLGKHPTYPDYVRHPMDLSIVAQKALDRKYKSPASFLADVKWIYHNSYVFFGTDFITAIAKEAVDKAKILCTDLEQCPDCIRNIRDEKDYFTEICGAPHPIVFAKLDDYPIWPAKVKCVSKSASPNSISKIDVQFFGEHEYASVNLENVYCYSKEGYDCEMSVLQKVDFETSMKELRLYCKKFKEEYGSMRCYPPKTQFDPKLHSGLASMCEGTSDKKKKTKK